MIIKWDDGSIELFKNNVILISTSESTLPVIWRRNFFKYFYNADNMLNNKQNNVKNIKYFIKNKTKYLLLIINTCTKKKLNNKTFIYVSYITLDGKLVKSITFDNI